MATNRRSFVTKLELNAKSVLNKKRNYVSTMDSNSISCGLEQFQGETALFAAKSIKSADNFWLESRQLFNSHQDC